MITLFSFCRQAAEGKYFMLPERVIHQTFIEFLLREDMEQDNRESISACSHHVFPVHLIAYITANGCAVK
jgi:hypothetical protein